MNRSASVILAPLLVSTTVLAACSGDQESAAAAEALASAYEECTGYAVVLSDGEFEAPDGDSGVGDGGRTVWVDEGRGQCVADRLEWPTRIEKAVRMGTSGTDSWDAYAISWDWEDPMGTGLSIIVSTDPDSDALPDADGDTGSDLENACTELGNGNLGAAAVHAGRWDDSDSDGDFARRLRELSMFWDWAAGGPAPALPGDLLAGPRDELVTRVLEEDLAPVWASCDEHVDDDARFDHELMAADVAAIVGSAWDRQGRSPLDTSAGGDVDSGSGLRPTDVDGWIRAIASNDPREIGGALAMTEPGSAAASYVLYRSIITQHVSSRPDRVRPLDDGYELCDTDGACFRLTDIEERDGMVADFAIEGDPVDEVIVGRSSSTTSVRETAVVHRVLAYRSPLSGSVWLVVRLENVDFRADLEITRFQTRYSGPTGSQRPARVYGPRSVPPGRGDYYVLRFDDAALGGAATVAVLKTSGSGWTVELDVPEAS